MSFISNSCGVGVVELSVLFLVDDEMVQLCVTPAEYGQNSCLVKMVCFGVWGEWICIKDCKHG